MPTVWSSRFLLRPVQYSALFPDLERWLASPNRAAVALKLGESVAWVSPAGDVTVDAQNDPNAPDKNWALRFSKSQASFIWTTDLVFNSEHDSAPSLHIDLSVREREHRSINVGALKIFPPACVKDLIEKWSLHAVATAPLVFSTQQQVPEFLSLLTSSTRPFPVLALSEVNEDRSLLLDLEGIVRRMAGLAQVVRVGKDVSFLLPGQFKKLLGGDGEKAKMWNVYNGAIRFYQMNLLLNGSPFDHKLWLPRDIRANHIGFEDELTQWVAFNSTLRVAPPSGGLVSYRGIRDATADLEAVTRSYENDLAETRRALAEARDSHAESVRKLEARVGFLEYRLSELQPTEAPVEHALEYEQIPVLRFYRAESGKRPTLDFAEDLEGRTRSLVLDKLRRLPDLIVDGGGSSIEKVKGGKSGQARGSLWEFRVNAADSWYRFFFAKGKRASEILVLTGHQKKRNDLDPQEIETAARCLERAWSVGWDEGGG